MSAIAAEIRQRPLLYVGLATAAFFLGGSIYKDGLFGNVTAAWVQAIGSVAAIFSSLLAVRVQLAANEAANEGRKAAVSSAAATLLQTCAKLSEVIAEALEEGTLRQSREAITRSIGQYISRIHAIPAHQIEDDNLQQACMHMGIYMDHVHAVWVDTKDDLPFDGKAEPHILKRWQRLRDDGANILKLYGVA